MLKFHINKLLAVRENQEFMPQFKLTMVCNPLLGYLTEIIIVVGLDILFILHTGFQATFLRFSLLRTRPLVLRLLCALCDPPALDTNLNPDEPRREFAGAARCLSLQLRKRSSLCLQLAPRLQEI